MMRCLLLAVTAVALVCLDWSKTSAQAQAPYAAAFLPARDGGRLHLTFGGGAGPVDQSSVLSSAALFDAQITYRGQRRWSVSAEGAPMIVAMGRPSNEVFLSNSVKGGFDGRIGAVGLGVGTLRWSGGTYDGDTGPIGRITTAVAFVDLAFGAMEGVYLRGQIGGRLHSWGLTNDGGFLAANVEAQLPIPINAENRLLVLYRFSGGFGAPNFLGHMLEARWLILRRGRCERLAPLLRYERFGLPNGGIVNGIEAGISVRLDTRRRRSN